MGRDEHQGNSQATPGRADEALMGAFRIGLRIAIQGERGSNSHMAALAMLGDGEVDAAGADGAGEASVEIVACTVSADVVAAVVNGHVDAAVLPIENSLHGSVAEHYDLLMQQPVRIDRESLLRIRHNLIAAPGVTLDDVRLVLSHPVALSQCRRFLHEMAVTRKVQALPFYDTAGSVKHVMAENLRDSAAIAPELAAVEYGATVLARGIEDHEENYTRFHLLRRVGDAPLAGSSGEIDKMSVALAVEHRPGSLVRALQSLAEVGVDLTQIESRPVPGRPWEYVFYVDLRIADAAMADRALAALGPHCGMVKELGRYKAA